MTGEDYRYSANMVTDRQNFRIFAVLLSAIFLLTSFNGSGQEKSDIGIFAGTSYYLGDLNPTVHYAFPSIAAGPIYRYNFNARNSIRGHAFYHGLRGSDNSGGIVTEFDAKFVDLGLDFEFNWEPYKTAHRKTKSSPYVFAGIGYGLVIAPSAGERSHITMPFGFGYKINVGRWLSAGFEASARKAFSDYVDGDSPNFAQNPEANDILAPFGNKDWYFFTGLFVTYKIFKFWDDCPTYD
jgi:hypothetical protein